MDVSLRELRELVWAGRPGVLRFMGLQRVGHDWATEPNLTDTPVHSPDPGNVQVIIYHLYCNRNLTHIWINTLTFSLEVLGSKNAYNFKSFDFIHKDSCGHVSKFCTQFVSCIGILRGACLTCSYQDLVQMYCSRLNFKVPPMASIWLYSHDYVMLHDKRGFAHVIKVTTQLTWIWRDYPGEFKLIPEAL